MHLTDNYYKYRWFKIIAIFLLSVVISFLSCYGARQLYTHTDRLDLAEFQKAKIANLETKIIFLENNDWTMAIQQLPPIVQDMLAALNEGIKQKKHREYERHEQPILAEKERRKNKRD